MYLSAVWGQYERFGMKTRTRLYVISSSKPDHWSQCFILIVTYNFSHFILFPWHSLWTVNDYNSNEGRKSLFNKTKIQTADIAVLTIVKTYPLCLGKTYLQCLDSFQHLNLNRLWHQNLIKLKRGPIMYLLPLCQHNCLQLNI